MRLVLGSCLLIEVSAQCRNLLVEVSSQRSDLLVVAQLHCGNLSPVFSTDCLLLLAKSTDLPMMFSFKGVLFLIENADFLGVVSFEGADFLGVVSFERLLFLAERSHLPTVFFFQLFRLPIMIGDKRLLGFEVLVAQPGEFLQVLYVLRFLLLLQTGYLPMMIRLKRVLLLAKGADLPIMVSPGLLFLPIKVRDQFLCFGSAGLSNKSHLPTVVFAIFLRLPFMVARHRPNSRLQFLTPLLEGSLLALTVHL